MRRFARVLAVVGIGSGLALLPATAGAEPAAPAQPAALAQPAAPVAPATPASPAAPGIGADLDDFEFESFDAVYELTRTADAHAELRVTETIVAVFPDFDQNRGFYRDIPEYYLGVRLYTDVESVVDENGDPVPWEWEYYQGFYSVALGDDSFVQGRQTYVITYTQVDTIAVFANGDEFYWDVNGTGWAQPFGEVTATVVLPPELAEARDGGAFCYLADGECAEPITEEATDDGGVRLGFVATDVAPGESLTLDIPFLTGTFVEGEPVPAPDYGPIEPYDPGPQTPGWVYGLPWVLGIGGIVVGVVARGSQTESSAGRKLRAHGIVIPQYEPPEGLNPMVAAMLIGEPNRAFAAQIVDLAVRGNIRIVEPDDDKGGSGPFSLELLTRDGLDDVEDRLLDELFDDNPPGARFGVKRGSDSLQAVATPVFRRVESAVASGGYRSGSTPTRMSVVLIVLALVAAVGAGLLFFYLYDTVGRFDAIELSMLVLFAAGWGVVQAVSNRSTHKPLTAKGRDTGDHLLGVKMYLEWAEADRIRFLQSPENAERVDVGDATQMLKLYEKLLPYAILFGIEDEWSQQLQARYEAARVPVRWTTTGSASTFRVSSTVRSVRFWSPSPPRPVVSRASGGYGTKKSSSWNSFFNGSSGRSGSGWSSSGGSSFSSGSSGGGFSGGGGGGGGGRGR